MSNYKQNVRRAWKSGTYTKGTANDGSGPAGSGDDAKEDLRKKVREKMEWIVEREACKILRGDEPQREEPKMKLAQFVKFREEKFGGVLFETRSEKVFTLSSTGAAVVKEIASGGGDQEIAARLKVRYDDKSGTLVKEATEFIATLKQNGLVTE